MIISNSDNENVRGIILKLEFMDYMVNEVAKGLEEEKLRKVDGILVETLKRIGVV